VHGNRPALLVLRGDHDNLAVGRTVITDSTDMFTLDDGRNSTHIMAALSNDQIVVVRKTIGLARAQTALDGGDAPRENEHDVLAKGGQLSLLAAAEPFAQSHK